MYYGPLTADAMAEHPVFFASSLRCITTCPICLVWCITSYHIWMPHVCDVLRHVTHHLILQITHYFMSRVMYDVMSYINAFWHIWFVWCTTSSHKSSLMSRVMYDVMSYINASWYMWFVWCTTSRHICESVTSHMIIVWWITFYHTWMRPSICASHVTHEGVLSRIFFKKKSVVSTVAVFIHSTNSHPLPSPLDRETPPPPPPPNKTTSPAGWGAFGKNP